MARNTTTTIGLRTEKVVIRGCEYDTSPATVNDFRTAATVVAAICHNVAVYFALLA
jgi:putative intracellular protease/amidase